VLGSPWTISRFSSPHRALTHPGTAPAPTPILPQCHSGIYCRNPVGWQPQTPWLRNQPWTPVMNTGVTSGGWAGRHPPRDTARRNLEDLPVAGHLRRPNPDLAIPAKAGIHPKMLAPTQTRGDAQKPTSPMLPFSPRGRRWLARGARRMRGSGARQNPNAIHPATIALAHEDRCTMARLLP